MASVRFFPFQSAKILHTHNYHINKVSHGLQLMRYLTTSEILNKKTPHTVGVMSWVRAARRRKYLEQQMEDTQKSDHLILREEQLARSTPQIHFRHQGRIRDSVMIDENIMKQLHIRPEIFLSQDKKTVICYHPPPMDYPIRYTKVAQGIFFGVTESVLSTFKDTLTVEEIEEGLKLREKDPRTWNTKTLSTLFKTKINVVRDNVPITREQKEIAAAEHELCESMSNTKMIKFKELQNWERLKYARETRGKEDYMFFRNSLSIKRKPKALIPPKK